jgi:hypothetical protein
LPAWLQGTVEEQCGVAGIAGCYAGLLIVWAAVTAKVGVVTALAAGLLALLATFHVVSTRLIEGRWITLGDVVGGFKRAIAFVRRWTMLASDRAQLRERPIHVVAAAVAMVGIGVFCAARVVRSGSYESPKAYIEQRGRELGTNVVAESFQARVGDARAVWLIWTLPDGKRLGELTTVGDDGRTTVVGDTDHVPKGYKGINPRDIFGQSF